MTQIDVQIRRTLPFVDALQLREAAYRTLARGSALEGASVEVAVVDDPTIHRLNRERLDHDWPTDVVSFLYEDAPVTGELIVSADTAQRVAAELGWDPAAELSLYVVHGTLHLLGFDDQTEEERAAMQEEEDAVLATFGWTAPRERAPVSSAPRASGEA